MRIARTNAATGNANTVLHRHRCATVVAQQQRELITRAGADKVGIGTTARHRAHEQAAPKVPERANAQNVSDFMQHNVVQRAFCQHQVQVGHVELQETHQRQADRKIDITRGRLADDVSRAVNWRELYKQQQIFHVFINRWNAFDAPASNFLEAKRGCYVSDNHVLPLRHCAADRLALTRGSAIADETSTN